MGVLHLRADRAVLPGGTVEHASLLVRGGVVEWAGATADCAVPPGAVTRRVGGTLVPGLVDAQVNGFGGHDFMTADPGGWREAGAAMLAAGTTSFVPTLISAPPEEMRRAIRRAAAAMATLDRPRALGLHLEGPLLSPRWPGAHEPAAVAAARPEHLFAYLEAGDGKVRMVTLAPERPGAIPVIERLAGTGVAVSVGHTDATYEQVRAAVGVGARALTHLFNAQRPLHHREPGVPGAAFDLPELTCGLILDLHHVHPAVARAALRLLPDRAYLVTDALAPAGLPAGRFELLGRAVSTEGGAPRLPDGTLFGSVLTMAAAFANAVGLGFSLDEAVRWTSTIPADLLGRSDLGRIAPGARADLVLLDAALAVRGVWFDGEEIETGPEDEEKA